MVAGNTPWNKLQVSEFEHHPKTFLTEMQQL